MQTRYSPLFLLGLAAVFTGLLVPVRTQENPAPGEDLIPCRHCDDKGRMPCRSCEGKGKLYKTCPQCDGGGRRPCRQCNKPNAKEPNEAGPGQIACGYCGGDGKFGAKDKRCPECGGDGTYNCPSCRGKGDHKCKKELPAGICPSCRFSGKETCSVCYGKRWVRRKPDPAPTRPDKENKQGAGIENKTGIDPDALLEGIQKRFDSLTAIHSRESELDTTELRRSCEKGLVVTKGFLQRVELFKDKPGSADTSRDLYKEILEAQKMMRTLKSDLFDLGSLLLEFDTAYRRCEARMDSRPKSPFTTTRKKKDLKLWSENMSISLKSAEKMADQLGKGEVFLAGKTSGKIEEDLNLFHSRVQSEETLAATVKPPVDDPRKGTAPAKTTAGEEGKKIYQVGGGASEKTGTGSDDSRKKPGRKPSAKTERRNGDDSGGGLLVGILCGLGGALAGAGILLLYLRKKHYF